MRRISYDRDKIVNEYNKTKTLTKLSKIFGFDKRTINYTSFIIFLGL